MNTVRLGILSDHFEEIGDYAMAEVVLRELISVKERQFGSESLKLVSDLYNLSLLQEAQNLRAEALRCVRRAYLIASEHGMASVELKDIKDSIYRLSRPQVA